MWRNPKTFRDTLTIVKFISALFGLTIFEIKKCRKSISIAYALILIIFYAIIYISQSSNVCENVPTHIKIPTLFTLWINVTVASGSIIMGWLTQKKQNRIISMLEEVDNTLEAFGVEKKYGKLFRSIILWILMWVIIIIIIYALSLFWVKNRMKGIDVFLVSTALAIPIILNSWVDITFVITVRCINYSLRKVNATMAATIENIKTKKFDMEARQIYRIRKITVSMVSTTEKRFTHYMIQTIKHVHLEIIHISRLVNTLYCKQFLFELIVEFSMITGSLYIVYFDVIKPSLLKKEIPDTLQILVMVAWVLVNSCRIVIRNIACTKLIKENETTGQIVRELDDLITDYETKIEVQQFSMQLLLHPLHFSPSGFVYLNNKLTTSFFGAVSTYVVIFVQMSAS